MSRVHPGMSYSLIRQRGQELGLPSAGPGYPTWVFFGRHPGRHDYDGDGADNDPTALAIHGSHWTVYCELINEAVRLRQQLRLEREAWPATGEAGEHVIDLVTAAPPAGDTPVRRTLRHFAPLVLPRDIVFGADLTPATDPDEIYLNDLFGVHPHHPVATAMGEYKHNLRYLIWALRYISGSVDDQHHVLLDEQGVLIRRGPQTIRIAFPVDLETFRTPAPGDLAKARYDAYQAGVRTYEELEQHKQAAGDPA